MGISEVVGVLGVSELGRVVMVDSRRNIKDQMVSWGVFTMV